MNNLKQRTQEMQQILQQRGYNAKKSVDGSNVDFKDKVKEMRQILQKCGYNSQNTQTNNKDMDNTGKYSKKETEDNKVSTKPNSLFEKTKNSSFENIPQYQEQKQQHRERIALEFKEKYGKDLSEFNQQDYYKWASEHGFKFMHSEQAGISENPVMGTKNTAEDKKEEKALRYLLKYNNRRDEIENSNYGKAQSFSAGARDSITFNTFKRLEDWSDKRDINSDYGKYAGALNEGYKIRFSDIEKKKQEEHPIASAVGNGAGELAKMTALRGAISKATGGVRWLASKPKWITSALNDGLTFAAINGVNTAGAGGSAKDIAQNTAIGGIGGAVGGAASYGMGVLGENILFKTGLQNKLIPEMARNAVAASSFSLADTASTYFLHPKDERPTAGEVAQNAAVSFAFASITTAINAGKIKKSSKAALDYVNERMVNDYDSMLKSANANDPVSVKKFAQNVVDYSEAMEKYLDGEGFKINTKNAASNAAEEYLTGKTAKKYSADQDTVLKKARFIGEDKRVKSIQEDLRTIRSRANEFLNKANSAPADAVKISEPIADTHVNGNTSVIPKTEMHVNNTKFPNTSSESANLPINTSVSAQPVEAVPSVTNAVDDILANMSSEAEKAETEANITDNTNSNSEILSNRNNQNHFSPVLVARNIIKQNNSTLKTSDITGIIKDMQHVLTDGAINENKLNTAWDMASKAGDLIAETSKEANSDIYDTYKDLRDKIRNTPISISNADKADIGGVDSFNEFRKNNFGGMRISDKGISIDSFYQELSEMYPNFFDAQKETHPAEQLMKIQNVLDDIKPVERNISDKDKEALSESVALQIYNECINNLPIKLIDEGNIASEKDTSIPRTEAFTTPTVTDITLNKVGDFYEAYGDDAVEIADRLNLNITSKTVNGEKVQMAGFPVHALESYKSALGNSYNIKISGYPLSTGVNAVNDKISSVLISMNETFLPDAKDSILSAMKQTTGKADINVFAEKLMDTYRAKGTIGAISQYFSDNGKQVISAIESISSKSDKGNEITDDVQLIKDYNNAVDNILSVSDKEAKEYADKRVAVEIEKNTPDVILDNVEDARDLKVIINYNKLYLAVRKDGVFKGHYHNLGVETAKKLPDFLENPDAIVQLGNGRLNLFTTVETDRGSNGIISVELNSTKDIGGTNEDYNVVVTMFSSNDQYAKNLLSGDGVSVKYKREDLSQVNPQLYKWLATINDKSSDDNIISKNNDIVNNSVRNNTENDKPEITNKCEIIATKHTSTGDDIWVVTLKDRISSEEYKDLSSKVKSVGGYYSRFAKTPEGKSIPGFIFKTEPKGDVIQVFNDFFDNSADFVYDNSQIVNVDDSSVMQSETVSEKTIEKDTQSDIIGSKSSQELNSQEIADFVKDKLKSNEKFTSDMLFKEAGRVYGGTLADNTFTVKDAYDAMELGVNQYLLSFEGGLTPEKMIEITEKLPTQTKRTEGMDKYQQFSTPPTIAYYANYAANVNGNDIMLEPSAGVGGIAVFAKKDGATVIVNELDKRRLSILKNMPFDAFYNENAEQINNILGDEIEPTVVVMNPPFSSSSERNIKSAKIGAKHIEEALKILAPNGRLVAITGKSMSDDAPAFRDWWKDIKSKYNVVANIGISGKNYNKYGTNFGIQMLVIDKNGTTKHTQTGYVENISDLQEMLGGIRNERPAITERRKQTSGETLQRNIKGEDGVLSEITEQGSGNRETKDTEVQPTEVASARTEIVDGGEVLSKSDNAVLDTSIDGDIGGRGLDSGLAGNTELSNVLKSNSDNRGASSNEQSETDVFPDKRADIHDRASTENKGAIRATANAARKSNVRNRLKKKELTDSIFEQYQTQPLKLKGVKQHPAKISESAAMSAINPPEVTYKPSIPDEIVKNGILSDVQLEAVTYAGQSHGQTLLNGNTRGFFVGDGTGVGKGRTLTGIILDNYMQGRKKSVWVTLNSSLFNDMKRDVKALFGNSELVHSFKGGKDADKSLSFEDGILAVSYDTLSSGWDNKYSNFEKIISWFGKDFDGVIVFDEAHKMANSGKKGTRGRIKPSQAALSGIELQKRLPKARVVYSSATGATEVENLRYAERLGLWGEGTAFLNSDDFVSKIKAGGLAAMELIARDMKAQGVYLSRNISYDDVRYDRITHKLTVPQRKIYDELANSWQIVFQNMSQALQTTNQISDGKAKQRAVGGFWGSQQRFFNQILTSMQVPSVIKDMEKQLADGNSCVVQLVSTNEAADKKEFARLKEAGLDLEDFDTTPKQMLMDYIEHCFPVQQYEEYRDDDGNKRSRPVFDSKGKPVINREAARQKEELLDKLGSIKVPSSPIDMIIDHFGAEIVAENTGRSRRVEEKNGKRTEVKLSGKKDADVDAFQSGKKRIIIFSKAGGTGKSYHADLSAKNQQHRVHYLLEPGWRADDAVQGFGRSHRSNQASSPTFKLVTTDLKGQMRFVSTIAKRLDQLGALTKGQRQAGSQGMFSASDNLENSFAQDVLAVFYKDLINNRVDGVSDGIKIIEKLGLKDKLLDEYGNIRPSAQELREVNKFLNRILCLDSKEQNTVFEGYSIRLEEATENAAQAGTLDRGLENYRADKISINECKDIRIDKSTGAATKYYNLIAKNKVKPVQLSELNTNSKDFLGYYQNNNTGAVRAVFKSTSRTDQYGNITENVKLYTQLQQKNGRPKCEYQPSTRLYANWKKLSDTSEAEKLWNEAIAKLPEYVTENIHLIGGVVLPVWDKLPTENVRIYRVLTDEGDMLIGRVIPENLIDGTLRRMGANRKKEKLRTSDLLQRIKQGDKVHLDNGWTIKQSRVSGEQRIEVAGPSYEHTDILKNKGIFTERISYVTRYFIPANTGTENIIDNVLDISPVERIEASDVNYNKGGDNDVMWGNNSRNEFKNIRSYTAHEKENWKNSKNIIVYENNKQLLDFIDKSLKVQSGKKIYFGKISKSLSDKIYNAVGLKTENFNISLKDYEIKKILTNSHGDKQRENMRGQEAVSQNDLTTIPFIIENADEIKLSKRLYEGKPVIEFYKNEGNRKTLIAYLSQKHKDLAVQTMYQSKKSLAAADDVQASSFTSKTTRGTASENIISQKHEKGNTNINNSLKKSANGKDEWQGDKNGNNTKKIYDIVSYLSKAFGVPISTGNLNYNRAHGQYKNFENSIRIKISNDLPTITHELGHLLDKKYNLREMPGIDEALDFAESNHPTLMQLYKGKDKLNEAVAEFTREYLKNPDKMKKAVPIFYKEFTEVLDEQDTAALEQASKYIQDYFNSSFREKVAAATITNKEIKKSEKGNAVSKSKQLYTKIVDDFAPINDVMEYVKQVTGSEQKGGSNAYTMAINSRNADAVTSFILKVGMADSNGDITDGKSFIDCIAEISPKNIRDFDNYLILKHSVEWLEPKDGKVKRVFADDVLQDVERIKEEISVYEAEHPEYKTAAKNLYEYQNNLLKMWVVDTGGMSEDLFKELQEKYPHYVPFKRYIGKNRGGVKTTFANQHTPISKAKGSGASIISPLESIMQNTSRFVKFGIRNKVMGTLVEYADKVEGFAQFMEEVPPDKIRNTIGIIPQVEKLKDVMSGLDEPDFLELSDALDNIFGDSVTSYTPVAKMGKQIVTYMEGGKYRYFQVHDTPLYEAIANMTPKQISGLNTLGKMLNATNVLITQFNYLFGIKNPIRDFDTALKHSKAYDNPFKFTVAYFAALKHIVTNSSEYKAYQAAGGGHMSNFSDNIDAVQKALHDISIKDMNMARRLAYSLFHHPIESLTRWNEITETIPRLTEFEGMKKQGADNQEAAYEAADITTNFNRSGETGRAINKVFRFNNAAVQGIDKEIRTFTKGRKKSIVKYIMRYLMSALMTSALIEFYNRTVDEEGWYELSNYQKNNFYCIAIGDGRFIKIPKAREAAIPNTLFERAIDFVFGDEDAFYQFGEYIGDTILPSMLPLDGLISGTIEGGLETGLEEAVHEAAGNTILGGIVDNAVNKDFKGTPIVSASLEDTPQKQQTNNKTTWLAYAIGQITNTSPLKADHLIDSYTGILGKLNRAFGTMDKEQIDWSAGIKNTFTTDSAYSTDTFNKIYERRDKRKKEFLDNPMAQNACLYEKYAYTAAYITKCNKIIKGLPPEERRKARQSLIDDVKNINTAISDTDKAIAKSFAGDVDDSYCVTSIPKEELSYSNKGKSYSYNLTYEEYREYVSDYIKEVEKQREKIVSKSKYSRASDDEKMEMLKEAKSEAAKNVKEVYKKKFKTKFKKVGE